MGVEIERKFLVEKRDWSLMDEGCPYRQGYFPTTGNLALRVRIAGDAAFLTVKGPNSPHGRTEFEYGIPVDDARQMLIEFCRKPIIEKTRYRIAFRGRTWEVDVFHGDNEGLVVAEVEIEHPDASVEIPPWVVREVTGDHRYNNTWLVGNPYCTWREEEESESGGD